VSAPHIGLRRGFRPEMGPKSVTLSVGTTLCPYPIAYRRAYGLSFRWTVLTNLRSPLCGQTDCGMAKRTVQRRRPTRRQRGASLHRAPDNPAREMARGGALPLAPPPSPPRPAEQGSCQSLASGRILSEFGVWQDSVRVYESKAASRAPTVSSSRAPPPPPCGPPHEFQA
jgi:hypothetical protein